MNSYINSLRKLAADIDNSRGKQQQQNTQELLARADLQSAPEQYFNQDSYSLKGGVPYASHGPGLRYQSASGTSHFFVPEQTGIKYQYNQWNTPIDTGNFALSRLLMNRAAGSPYHSTTVADAINMQVQDPHYVTKYRQHLNRQAQRSGDKPLYHGFWPYTSTEFDKVMSTPLSRLIKFDRQLRAGGSYNTYHRRIRLPYTGIVMAGYTHGKPALSTLPRTSQQSMISSYHAPAQLGTAAMHQVNHYMHIPKGFNEDDWPWPSALPPMLDAYSKDPSQQTQMNAAYTRGKYALIQKLRSNPNDPAFRQFDKQKLKQIAAFPQFIGTDTQGLQQFRRQMRFWRQNPQLAQMLGAQAARTVGSYTQLLNARDHYKKEGESERVQNALEQVIRSFQDNRYLGDARRQQYQKQLRNAQRTQYA